MVSRRMMVFFGSVILAIVCGFLIGKKQLNKNSENMTVRSYSVPPGRGEEIRGLVNRLFSQNINDGAAQVFDSRIVVVKAPESYQSGIEKFIENASKEKGPKRPSLKIAYWLVKGEISSQSNSDLFGPLTETFKSIEKSNGTKKFHVLEHLSFTSLSGRETEVKGALAEVKTFTSFADNQVDQIELVLEVRAKERLGEIRASTRVDSGQTLILGETSLQKDADDIAKGKIPPTDYQLKNELYHIIRAETLQ